MTTSDDIYKQDGNDWVTVEPSEEIALGVYRLKYLNNGKEAYIIAVLLEKNS